jgi:hypothetical protein
METIAIPLVAMAGLYLAYNQDKKSKICSNDGIENFDQRTGLYENKNLPNIDVPNTNYPEEYPVQNPPNDLTSKLSTVNMYDGNSAYTDKYFNPNSTSSLVGSTSTENSSMFSSQVPNPTTAQYVSLTGQTVGADYFQHQNMQPFFGSHLRTIRTDANSTESMMDSYTGSGSQIINKTERAPLFAPQENYQWPLGMPNQSDFYQSRVNPSMKQSNVKPFAEEYVGPGIGVGYGSNGFGGYNSGLMARDLYLDRGVDELRTTNNPKPGGNELYGYEGPAGSAITQRGILGDMQKNRVDTSFELGSDRWFTTTGGTTAPACRGIDVLKNGSRQDTSVSYVGGAGASDATYVDGEYMPSKHIDLGQLPIAPPHRNNALGANEGDFGNKSRMIYQNNRSANEQDTYFGAFGGAIGAVVAPLLDALRPSRRENTIGTLRPYQNPGSTVSNSYVFNPADRPSTTIKETTEDGKGHLFVDRNQSQGGTGYLVAGNQPIVNNRMTQSDFYYTGVGSAGERGNKPRTYNAEYNQRNNDVKSSTLSSYTPGGKLGLYSGQINQTAKQQEQLLINKRDNAPTMPFQSPSPTFMGQQAGPQSQSFNSGIQLDRNAPDILSQLQGNPFAISHLNGL